MNIFISFIGSNDAGKLLGKEDEGAILTILQVRKFDKIYLLYNANGFIKGTAITYEKIAEYLKDEILNNNYCSSDNLIFQEMSPFDIANHLEVYPILLSYLEQTYDNELRENANIYAGISSGTPAMQVSWVILAESDVFPLKLIRAVEKIHAKNNQRVFDVELLTGTREKLQQLKKYESRIGFKSKASFFTIEDTMNLNDKQLQIALSDKHILIYGETGVGKEVLAKTLHESSNRNKFVFIPVNCAGLPENLLESELFGHVKGSFTGAVQEKRGIVEEFSNGTLFLDEIISMPTSIQTKLLRFLENGEYRKLGSNKTEKSSIRIIAAANENIQRLVTEGKFREDLYYRLRTYELFIPPLRERKDNIPQLIARIPTPLEFTPEAIQELQSYDYRGNIRELKIILERLRLYAKSNKVDNKMVKNVLAELRTESKISDIEIPPELEGKAYKLLRQILTNAALKQTQGNTFAAAKILGVTHPSKKKWAEEEE